MSWVLGMGTYFLKVTLPKAQSSWPDPVSSWACVLCTLDNPAAESSCQACGGARSTKLGIISIRGTLYTIHSTLYTLHSTIYTLHSTLYTLHSTLYTLHSTLHSTLCLFLLSPVLPDQMLPRPGHNAMQWQCP